MTDWKLFVACHWTLLGSKRMLETFELYYFVLYRAFVCGFVVIGLVSETAELFAFADGLSQEKIVSSRYFI